MLAINFLGLLGIAQASSLSIPFEKYELENGLDVILSEDHSVPFVQVNIWYNVGAKDENEGKTGFAHLFEHLMFQGSEHHDTEYFAPLQPIGARVNGTTNMDRTNYFEGVPSEYLPLALWLESDRMGWLLPALTEDKLSNQKLVVRNERRQSYEIRPYGEVWPWLYENLYPSDHPYHVPTIGKHEDIENASMEDVVDFFKTWYVPNNASLVICGDFDPETAKSLVEQYFGEIKRGPDPSPRVEASATLEDEKIVRKTDKVPHSKVWIAWLSPKLYGQGDADLDILSTLLSDGKESLLYSKLVDELQIAKDIRAYQSSSRLQSQYIIEATAAKGHTTDGLVTAIDEALASFKQTSSEDEALLNQISIAKDNWEARFYSGLQSIARKANQLNSYNILVGDPGYIEQDLQRYMDVTAQTLLQTTQTVLDPNRRVVLHVTPEPEENDASSTPESE
ncbi:MAG: peptidase M16 [Proteobacteria bacterium]|nr:peptidase M16 [Pseudomonadota bacterium]